MKRSVNSLL
ncbi:hypothetical protein VCHC17A1_1432A, partial [Vibrio cholerae HC-17A1]